MHNQLRERGDQSLDPPEWRPRRAHLSRAEAVAAAVGVTLVLASWMFWAISSAAQTPDHFRLETWGEENGAKVSVNQAVWQELLVLPGVGQKTAERIVSERESNGPYKDLDDMIKRVGRLPRERLIRFAPYIEFRSTAGIDSAPES